MKRLRTQDASLGLKLSSEVGYLCVPVLCVFCVSLSLSPLSIIYIEYIVYICITGFIVSACTYIDRARLGRGGG